MEIIDDKSEYCIPFLLERLQTHQEKHGENAPPFFLGLNGVQGAGKTTLVSGLSQTLHAPPHNLNTAVLSLDDFYLLHADQLNLAKSHPSNPLVQHRGQPSTHDLPLLKKTLASLRDRHQTSLPAYDKSLFSGAGDRTDASTWTQVNTPGKPTIDIVILEGWCVNFRPHSPSTLQRLWERARSSNSSGQLRYLALEDVEFVNEALRGYMPVWEMFDAFVHIDARETEWVYEWRLEAERRMREERGSGMSDEEVRRFVDGYYPAYELYTQRLREGVFEDLGRHLRLIVGKDRRVIEVEEL